MLYELYLLDHDRRLVASEFLEAADDQAAHRAGSVILDVCKDVADEYEVWRAHKLVARGRCKIGLFKLRPVVDNRQANIIDVLERLQRGFTPVHYSTDGTVEGR